MNFLAQPFGIILRYIYRYLAFENYGLAIIIFTLFVKLLLFPLSLKQQLSTIKTQALQPELDALKKTYGNDNQALMQEQQKLYQKYNVNPMAGCLPTLLTFPVIIVVYQIIRAPLTYISVVSSDIINKLKELINLGSVKDELTINSYLLNNSSLSEELAAVAGNIKFVNMRFLGLDLGVVPKSFFENWDWSKAVILIIPILVLVSQYVVQWYSSPTKGKKKEKGADPTSRGMGLMLKLMPLFTFGISLFTPAALGFYWVVSNLLSLLQTFLINTFFFKKKNEKEVL